MNKNMTTFVMSIAFSLVFMKLNAQCPNPNATLSFGTQEAVDDWLVDYPDCTHIDRDFSIGFASGPVGPGGNGNNNPLRDLFGFQNIETIEGELSLKGPPGIWSGINYTIFGLAGMTSLQSAHTLEIDDLPDLNSVSFPSLQTVNILILKDLPNLQGLVASMNGLTVLDTLILDNVGHLDLSNINFSPSMDLIRINEVSFGEDGLSALKDVEEVGHLSLRKTDITSIDSEININVTGELDLTSNELLEDISGLYFNSEIDVIRLFDNPMLTEGVENFEKVERVNWQLFISHDHDISFFAPLKHIQNLILWGSDTVTDFSIFQNLESIGDIQGSNLPEEKDLGVFSDVAFVGSLIQMSNIGFENLNNIKITNLDTTYSVSLINCEFLNDISFLTGVKNFKNLRITGCPDLTNLAGLENLEDVSNQLSFIDLENLESLNEISNLASVRVVEFINLGIQDFAGVEGLRRIFGWLQIKENPNLRNLDAFSSLEYLGIDDNSADLEIVNNPLLESIDGLNKLKGNVNGVVSITGNSSLSYCSIDFVCNTISHGEAFVLIENNLDDCNTVEEIIDQCGFNFLEVFLDDDGNGIQDAGEPNISIGKINVGDLFTLFLNSQGRVGFFLEENPGFIEYVPEEFWEVTTNNTITNITDFLQLSDLIKIGIKGTSNFTVGNASISFQSIVCNREYDITATIKNEGTERFSGIMSFTAPGDYLPVWPFPSDTTNNIITFDFGELLPGQTSHGTVTFVAPSVDEVDLGTILNLNYTTEITDPASVITEESGSYDLTFLCAYDPNDKQVFPSGVYEENYTLFEDDEFEYLIRFQNTGNYPAQDVSITDTLDQNLDPSTFELLSASHEVTRIKLEGHNLAFDFRNIFLPDSLNNEPESHGYVQFRIKSKGELDENTRIENTANIFFDFNPAIITNTVYNTMVSQIPSSNIFNLDQSARFSLFPNPASGEVILSIDEIESNLSFTIFDMQGKSLISSHLQSIDTPIKIDQLVPGLYFVKVKEHIEKLIVN